MVCGALPLTMVRLTAARMIKVSNAYGWEEICDFTDEDMENLLTYYADNKVPTVDDLQAMRRHPEPSKTDIFDGSFGFCVGV